MTGAICTTGAAGVAMAEMMIQFGEDITPDGKWSFYSPFGIRVSTKNMPSDYVLYCAQVGFCKGFYRPKSRYRTLTSDSTLDPVEEHFNFNDAIWLGPPPV